MDGDEVYDNDTDCTTSSVQDVTIYFATGFQILVCICSVSANAALTYKQRKILLWYSERPLYLGILVANSIASAVHLVKAVLEIFEHAHPKFGDVLNFYESRMNFVGDTAVGSAIYSISALTITNFRQIWLLHRGSTLSHSKNQCRSIIALVLIWILACAFAAVGFGIHEEYAVVELPEGLVAFGHYGLTIVLQLIMAALLFQTRLYSKKVQVDFAVSRAEQNLDFRIFLSRVTKRTRTIVPILATNAGVWIFLTALDALVDRVLRLTSICNDASIIWDVLTDVITITFCAVYPFLLVRDSLRTGKRCKSILCCGYNVENDVTVNKIFTIETRVFTMVHASHHETARPRGNYWSALRDQWDLVKRERTTRL